MRLLPRSRRRRVALAGGLAAVLLALAWYVFEYRPWEAHYLGRPTSWWAAWVCDPEGRKPRPPWENVRDELLARMGVPPPPGLWAMPDLLRNGRDPEAIPVLIELLEWPNDEAREWAAFQLFRFGP